MAEEKFSSTALEKDPTSLEEASALPSHKRNYAQDADEAMKAFEDGEVEVIDEETSRRLLRTIDLNIMPVSLADRRDRSMRTDKDPIALVCSLWTQLSG